MILWLLPIFPALAGLAIWAAGDRDRRMLAYAGGGGLSVALLLAGLAAANPEGTTLAWTGFLSLKVALTPLSAVVAILVPLIALPIVIFAAFHEKHDGLGRLVGLLLFFVGGMELVVIADDLLTLLIGWEIIGACSWALISHKWRDPENPASGDFAFLATRLGDLGLILAVLALYYAAGDTTYEAIRGVEGPAAWVVAYGILIAAAAKSGQLPFSNWLFRAMAGPTSVSSLLHAATLVAAGAYALIRLQPYLSEVPGWEFTVIAVGAATALAGGFVATIQNHAKKLLAASTSSQLGLMFVAVGAGFPGVALLHLVAHATFKAPLFLASAIAGEKAGSFKLEKMGYARHLPGAAALSALAAAALAALPPLGGGWTKEKVLTSATEESLVLGGLIMLVGTLSAIYAMRFQLLAYGWRKNPVLEGRDPYRSETGAVAGLVAMTVGLSILWLPAAKEAVKKLLEVEIPPTPLLETIIALTLLLAGLAIGYVMVRRSPDPGLDSAADWLGLPTLIDRAVTRPTLALARWSARADDDVIDGMVRGVVFLTRSGAGLAGRIGEAIVDGMPEGTAWLMGLGGTDLRKLQTGYSHHYFVILASGLVVAIAILAIGA